MLATRRHVDQRSVGRHRHIDATIRRRHHLIETGTGGP